MKTAYMKIGFTGSRHGMTLEQEVAVSDLLDHLFPVEFHHGDCIGADERAHGLAFESNGERVKRVIHPPENESLRAFCEGDETREPRPYLLRDRQIVDDTDVLIAVPHSPKPEPKSGTWYTVRYARAWHKRIFIVNPDGSVIEEKNR